MALSETAKKRRLEDIQKIACNASTIVYIGIVMKGALLLLQYTMSNKLTPDQRKAMYALALLATFGMLLVSTQVPQIAILIGVLIGILLMALREL